ncbi:hypothetical protein THASP1DRAFT_23730 [Thamnocephalis sphaerospora]|uniref:Snurportin-1 n=1 Tax=Thamnocephalis sphaerospora TaxID=78915 RepID=A0A4P9XQD8_9FUNG|nr:hypothetical protein THASP1DRAFT_23730 [Thamnocephalis sphaerospora]|eukprot:RKP08238.1 hypothetical protein THASP1DRAFT_23730 [Thamnocephalis sphaerospora]
MASPADSVSSASMPPPASPASNAAVNALTLQLETATCSAPRAAIKPRGVSSAAAQQARRQRHLEAQQQRKRDFTAHLRRLTAFEAALSDSESDSASDTELDEDTAVAKDETKMMTTDASKPSACGSQQSIWSQPHAQQSAKKPQRKQKQRRRRPLMEGELMQSLPDDLADAWYAALYPVGKRCWVVATAGCTVSRLRNGSLLAKFESSLPAGSRAYRGNRSADYCILDCIYVERTFTYYVLDLMCWKGHPFFDCDTEFRQFWLQTQLAELDPLRPGSGSFYSFTALPAAPATPEHLRALLQQAMAATAAATTFAATMDAVTTTATATTGHAMDAEAEAEVETEARLGTVAHAALPPTSSAVAPSVHGALFSPTRPDGLMLVHRQTRYVLGHTPLCGWLPVDDAAAILARHGILSSPATCSSLSS